MKRTTIGLSVILLGLVASGAFAGKHLPEERGKTLFEDPKAFAGRVSCNQCHPGGSGLEESGAKTKFNIMGQTQNSLEEAVNFCIVNANEGEAIPEDSDEMKEIVAYINSLGSEGRSPGTAPGYGAPGYGAPGY
jgi:cytochrome c